MREEEDTNHPRAQPHLPYHHASIFPAASGASVASTSRCSIRLAVTNCARNAVANRWNIAQSAVTSRINSPGTKHPNTNPLQPPTTPLPEVLSGVVEHLTKAMKEGSEVYIAYANHDPKEKQARKIKPVEWIRFGEAFKAFCFIGNIDKTFNTPKILRIEDQLWSVTPEGI